MEATKIELLTKCLLEGIDYKTMLNHSLGSEGGTSSKKVTPMKSNHTAHSSPLPTAKKPHLQKSGSSAKRYDCNFTGGSSETKLRKSANNTQTPEAVDNTNVYNSSLNDRSSINFENMSYNNY